MRHHHAARGWLRYTLPHGLCGSGCGLSGNRWNRSWRLRHRSPSLNGFRRSWQRFSDRCRRRLRLANRGCCCGRFCGRFLLGARLLFAHSGSRGRLHYNSAWGWRHHDDCARAWNYARWRLRHHGARWRAAGNRRSGWRRCNDRRGRARLRNDFARFRAGWSCGRLSGSGCRRRRSGGHGAHFRLRRLCRRRRSYRHPGVACLFFLFVLLGQDRLQHIAGFLDVRQVDLRNNRWLRVARRAAACMGSLMCLLLQARANLVRFVRLQRAGVRLASSDAEFRKKVENRARLDFKLFREIVDTNLTHPPLFSVCAANPPLVAHSYLMALAALFTCVIVRLAFSGSAHLTRRPL